MFGLDEKSSFKGFERIKKLLSEVDEDRYAEKELAYRNELLEMMEESFIRSESSDSAMIAVVIDAFDRTCGGMTEDEIKERRGKVISLAAKAAEELIKGINLMGDALKEASEEWDGNH